MTHLLSKHYTLSRILPGVSPVIYGCMGLGGDWNNSPVAKEDLRLAHRVVDAAVAAGINFFDHADIYTFGKAEEVFGRVLNERPELRQHIYLQSKCAIRFQDEQGPKRYDFSKEWLSQSVDEILARLNIEYLDILLLHRPDPLMEPEELADTFRSLKASGKVRHFGVSNMHGQQMAFLQGYLDAPLVVNQIEVSLSQLDWLDEGVMAGNPAGSHLNFAAGTLEYCRQQKVQVQSWGSLCQGLFSGRDVSNEPLSVQATAALVAEYAECYETSRESIVLAWLMRHPVGIQPVIGTTNVGRISACAQSTEVTLSREQWYALYVAARGEEVP